jgi:hypothetical protein
MGEPPMIQCTPPTDPVFLNAASRAFESASQTLDSEVAVLIGTVLRIRALYPSASIITVASLTEDGRPCLIWLISRDGWTPIEPAMAWESAPAPAPVGLS